MANELDHVYFVNHTNRALRPSDDVAGEASVHGLSLASNAQIGTIDAGLKIFKLDSTGNFTTSNNLSFSGIGGPLANTVTVSGLLSVQGSSGLIVNTQGGIEVSSSNNSHVYLKLDKSNNFAYSYVQFVPDGTITPSNLEYRLGTPVGSTEFNILAFDGTSEIPVLAITTGLEVLQDTVFDKDVEVSGTVTASGLIVQNDIDVSGNVTITGNLVVSGTITSDSLVGGGFDPSLPLTLGSTLNVSGATILETTLEVSGATTLRSTLDVEDLVTVSGLTVQNDIDVTGNVSITGNLVVSGNIISDSLPDPFDPSLALTLGSTLNVSGATTLETTLVVSGASTLHDDLNVSGLSTLSGLVIQNDVDVTGNVSITGNLVVSGNIISDSLPDPFDPSLALTLGSTLNVSGATTLETTLVVSGATTLHDNLNVSGLSTLSGLVVQNDVDVTGNVAITGSLTVSGGIISSTITDLENDIAAHEDRLDVMDIIDGTDQVVVFENNALVFGDAHPGVQDPDYREGWYFKNEGPVGTNQNKVNWYFDGHPSPIHLDEFSVYAIVTFDSIASTPHLGIYTETQGVGDAAPWYRSKRVYVPSAGAMVGVKYLMYVGEDPKVRPDLPRLTTTLASSEGPQAPTETILAAVLGSDSNAAIGNTEFVAEAVGSYSPNFKRIIKLDIRKPSVTNVQTWDATVLSDAEAYTDQAIEDFALNPVQLGNTLNVTGAVTLHNDLTVSGLTTTSGLNVQHDADFLGDVAVSGDLTVAGMIYADLGTTIDLSSPVELGSTLEVTGATTLLSTLDVSGLTTLSGLVVQNNVDVTGNVSITGNLVVSGNIISDSLPDPFDPSLALTLGSTLNVSGATTLETTLVVSGAATLHDDLTVSGLSTLSGLVVQNDVDVTGNVSITGNLVVSGNIISDSLPDPFDPSLPLTLGSTLNVSGATTLETTLVVSGASTLHDTLNVSGLTTLSGLVVENDVDILDDLFVSGDLVVAGMIYADLGTTIDLSSPVELGSTLEVTGATTLLSTLDVSGLTTLSGLVVQNNVDVTGNVSITGNLVVSGNIISDSLPDPFDPSLVLTLGSTLNVSGATTLETTLVVSGAATLHDDLTVSGLSTFSGAVVQNDVDITGNVFITGDLTVGGQVFADLGLGFDTSQPLVLGSTLEVTGATLLRDELTVEQDTHTSGLFVGSNAIITGTTSTKGLNSYTSANAGPATSGHYAPVLDVSLDEQGDFISMTLAVAQDGGGTKRNAAIIHLRVKQQNTMADPLPEPPATLTLSEEGLAEWSAVPEATEGYEYQFSLSATPDENSWVTTLLLQASEDFSGYVGQTVYVFVRSKTATQYTTASVYVNQVAPSNVTLDDEGNASWSAIPGVVNYEYEFSTSSTPTENWAITGDTTATADFSGYSTGQTIYFFVKAQGSPNYATASVVIPTPNVDVLDFNSPSVDESTIQAILGLEPLAGDTDLATLNPIENVEVSANEVDFSDIVT